MTAATGAIFCRWSAALINHPLMAINGTKDPVRVFSTCVNRDPLARAASTSQAG